MLVQIRHGFAPQYYIDAAGQVYNAKTKKKLSGASDKASYTLITEDGKRRSITKRKLVELVFNQVLITDNIERLPGEIFKVIPGSAGKYQISSEGRLLSYQRNEAAIMQPSPNSNSNGYLRTMITIDGKPQNKLIHLLVAEAFCEKPEVEDPSVLQVHHKTFNRYDNRAVALEWLTPEEHQKKHLQYYENKENPENECPQSTIDNCYEGENR